MNSSNLSELLKSQKSLTEWLEDIKHSDAAAIRREDNEKRERLKTLNQLIDLPYDKPTQFEATQLSLENTEFLAFLREHGEELCALRLMPKKDGLPKLRMRGKSIAGAYDWYKEQNIDPKNYRADFVPHAADSSWATIFIVNKHGIFGEIIFGGHHQLTQGFHDDQAPHVFAYDFKDWSINPANEEALAHLKELVSFIHVPSNVRQKELEQELEATFTHDYIEGYFETTDSAAGTWYIDYSQSLGRMYADTVIGTQTQQGALVAGRTGSSGSASGEVRIVSDVGATTNFPDGAILVCPVTTPQYVPLMQKAAAIVTDQGGILSHAAIVARELGKPCIVGTTNATSTLKDGDIVFVDADAGSVQLQEAA